MKSQPNAFVMADAIKEEMLAADRENRISKSSNAISIFRKKSKARLSNAQVNALFDFVFHEVQKLTGARVVKYGQDGDN
jgi:hypothetical protein